MQAHLFVWEGKLWHLSFYPELTTVVFYSEHFIPFGFSGSSAGWLQHIPCTWGRVLGVVVQSIVYAIFLLVLVLKYHPGDQSQFGFSGAANIAERGALFLRNLSHKAGEAEHAWQEGNVSWF